MVGSSRIRTFAPEATRIASESRLQLPAREDRHLLLCVGAREEEPSQQRAGLVRGQPGPALSGLEHRALATDLLGVLGQEAELDVVAASQLAVAQREPAGQRLDQRGLAGAVGADQGHVLAPLQPQLGAFEQLALARRDRRSLELQRDAPAARGLLELEPRRIRPRGGRAPDGRSSPASSRAPGPGGRAFPRGSATTNRSRRSISACWRSTARCSASSRAAFSLRQACHGPAKKRDRPASSSRTAVPTASRNQRSCATRTIAASAVVSCSSSHSSDATSRWLVGSSSSSRSGSPARVRARAPRVSSPPEKVRQRPDQVCVREAESPHHRRRTAAPVIAAGVLEPSLRGRIVVERRLSGRPRRHLLLQPSEPLLELDQVGAAGQHVLAQAQVPLARRALVVESDPGALLERQLACVDRRLTGEHAEQRGLARAVASRQRKPVSALDLERDAPQQGIARHVLPQPGCDRDRHRTGW